MTARAMHDAPVEGRLLRAVDDGATARELSE